MPSFSKLSRERLSQASPDLQFVLNKAINLVDFTVVCSYRGQDDQDKAVAEGKSKTPWPTSKHNIIPSRAVDIAPYYDGKIQWGDKEAFCYMAGIIMGIAQEHGIKLRWGHDWDRDGELHDQTFIDSPHIEVM